MRILWIKYVIWLLALSVTCTLSAVIQNINSPSSSTQTATVSTVEQTKDRLETIESSAGKQVVPTEVSDVSSRNDKSQSNATAIGESIKMVASQLLHSKKTPPPHTAGEQAVTDTRTPPFMKNQVTKTKVTPKPAAKIDEQKRIENSHAGVAIPVSAEELEKEVKNKLQSNPRKPVKETSTSSEGLSTWVLVNGKSTTTTKPETKNKNENAQKSENTSKENKKSSPSKSKPTPKPVRTTTVPQIKPIFVRKPVAISSNKSDLIASGSAVDETEMNKIKASVLASVQKNAALSKTTTASDAVTSTTENNHNVEEKEKNTSKEIMIKINQVNLKDKKKFEAKEKQAAKENNVSKVEEKTETEELESKQAEIELPVSTPASVSKPKSKKKNKNRRRKPSTSSKLETKVDDVKDKDNKKVKINKTEQNPADIYSFISRKVIPSVGIGLVSLAGLFGIASYFFNPFATLRRSDTLIERKDLYHYNDEQYADDGGQREEDVLGSLFSDPVDNKVQNTHIRQTPNRYQPNPMNPVNNLNPTQFVYPKPKIVPSSTEQNVRYRNVGYGSETSNFVSNDRIGPKSADIIQGSAYSENIHYDTHSNDNREPYAVYPQPQPVYKSPDRQVDNSEYGADVYHAVTGYSSHQLADPTYGQPLQYNSEMFDSNNTPMSNVHLNDEDVIEHQKETGYTVDALTMDSDQGPQFVVGNIPKELIQATPVTVPEHGPRSLKIRRKRSMDDMRTEPKIESAADSLKIILKSAPKNEGDTMSNEIDDDGLSSYKKDGIISNTYQNSYRNETFERIENDGNATSEESTKDSTTNIDTTTEGKDIEPLSTTTSSSSSTEDNFYTYTDHKYPFLDFVRSLLDFKLRLGIGILKATSDNLARYLKDVENHFNITTPQARSRFR